MTPPSSLSKSTWYNYCWSFHVNGRNLKDRTQQSISRNGGHVLLRLSGAPHSRWLLWQAHLLLWPVRFASPIWILRCCSGLTLSNAWTTCASFMPTEFAIELIRSVWIAIYDVVRCFCSRCQVLMERLQLPTSFWSICAVIGVVAWPITCKIGGPCSS